MLGFWVSVDQKMIEKTLPQMALFEPEMASAAPEMASAVTQLAVEVAVVTVGSAVYWSDSLFSASNPFCSLSVQSAARWLIGVAAVYR